MGRGYAQVVKALASECDGLSLLPDSWCKERTGFPDCPPKSTPALWHMLPSKINYFL